MRASTPPWYGRTLGAAGVAGSHASAEALGRFQGGFNCRIHALTDALGLPMRFILTGGQAADITQATPLRQDIITGAVLADKGYDANALEGMFGKIKYFCRVATRYEKKASHFMEMLTFAAVLLWLR